METVVDKIYADFEAVAEILRDRAEPSLLSSADSNFRKSLLMIATSYFENRLTSEVLSFSEEIVDKDTLLPSFLKNKAILRQYHTWFDWDARNANRFISLFGEDFKKYMKAQLETQNSLEVAISDFMELGRDRNRLVHTDYGSLPLEKTSAEIYSAYKSANVFVEMVPDALRKCSASLG